MKYREFVIRSIVPSVDKLFIFIFYYFVFYFTPF